MGRVKNMWRRSKLSTKIIAGIFGVGLLYSAANLVYHRFFENTYKWMLYLIQPSIEQFDGKSGLSREDRKEFVSRLYDVLLDEEHYDKFSKLRVAVNLGSNFVDYDSATLDEIMTAAFTFRTKGDRLNEDLTDKLNLELASKHGFVVRKEGNPIPWLLTTKEKAAYFLLKVEETYKKPNKSR